MRSSAVTVLVALALVTGACSGDGIVGSAATLVPADAAAFIELDSDLDSEQWQQLDALLQRFPDRARLLAEIREELAEEDLDWERDVDPAFGETTAIVWIDLADEGENVVVLTQPDDEQKLRELVEKVGEREGSAVREVDGWTAVAESDALIDRLAGEGDSLADEDSYASAVEDLPDGRIATAYVDVRAAKAELRALGSGFGTLGLGDLERIDSIAAAVTPEENGLDATFVARAAEGAEELGFGESYDSRFVDEVPGDALAFVSFDGGSYREQLERLSAQQREQLEAFEQMSGASVDELLALLEGEGALYVRPGTPIPEVTLLLEAQDEQRAVSAIDRVAQRVAALGGGAPRTSTIDGVTVKTLQVGFIGVNYGAFDGKLVLSLSTSAFRELRGDGPKLADDPDYQSALEAAAVPAEISGLIYLDVEDTLPILEGLLGFAGADADVPPEVLANLRPLRSIVAYTVTEDDQVRFVLFAHIE